MATYFLDTSALVKRYVVEPGTSYVRSLTDPTPANNCWLVAPTEVELLAAIYRRVRSGSLPLSDAQQTEAVFRHEWSSHFRVIAVGAVILDRAMGLVVAHPLRAYDAIQLSGALHLHSECTAQGFAPPVLLSSDQELNKIATSEGLAVDDPNQHP